MCFMIFWFTWTAERSWVASEIEVSRLVFTFHPLQLQAYLVRERKSDKYFPE